MPKTNAEALALIKQFEGFVDHWYPDPAHGWDVPTCCYGHTDAAGEPKYAKTKGKTFTPGEGAEILARDLERVEFEVASALTVDINENQFGALVSFTFNLGGKNLAKSTLLKKVNRGDFAGAAQEFGRWNKANGKVLAGLSRRRAAEKALFLAPAGKDPAPGTQEPSDQSSPATGLQALIAAIINFILALFGRKPT